MKTTSSSLSTADNRIVSGVARLSSGVSRRDALRSIALTAAAAALPSRLTDGVFAETSQLNNRVASTSKHAKNPKWYGFNLLEYFSSDSDWMKYFPYKNDGMFVEDDFRWIRDWGFNWVRLPMDYRFWTDPQDLRRIQEEKVAPVDRAIRLGDKYGVHVNLCLHRAPGYCILDTLNEALTGIHITKEKSSVFSDPKMLEAFVYQWTFLSLIHI